MVPMLRSELLVQLHPFEAAQLAASPRLVYHSLAVQAQVSFAPSLLFAYSAERGVVLASLS